MLLKSTSKYYTCLLFKDSRIDHSVNCPVLLDWSYQRTNQTTRSSHVTTNATNSTDHLCDVTEVAPNVTTVSTQTGNVTPDVLQRVLKPAADVTGQGQGQEGAVQHSGTTSAKVTQGQTGVKLTKSLMTGGGASGPRVSTNQNQPPHDTQKQVSYTTLLKKRKEKTHTIQYLYKYKQ